MSLPPSVQLLTAETYLAEEIRTILRHARIPIVHHDADVVTVAGTASAIVASLPSRASRRWVIVSGDLLADRLSAQVGSSSIFMLKPNLAVSHLPNAIRAAARSDLGPAPLALIELLLQEQKNHHLTQREKDVLINLRGDSTNKDVAHKLGLCESTIKVYMRRLFRKLGVRSRSELVLWWQTAQLLDQW